MTLKQFATEFAHAVISRLPHKSNPANPSILAVVTPGMPRWSSVDYASLSQEGYINCTTVFACVSLIAKSASRIEWYMTQKKGGGLWEEFDEHPCIDLLRKPNESESGIRFSEKVFSYLMLNGNAYITKVAGIQSAPPRWMYVQRPDRMTVIPGNINEPVKGYEYKTGMRPVPFKTEDVLHIMEFHPLDDWYGLSRIQVAARDVDISNQSDEWNKNNLSNNMNPPGIITAKNVSADDVDRYRTMFKENYQGAANAGTPLVFSGEDVQWTTTAMNPKDVEWLNGQKLTMRKICAVFGVPSMLLGDTEATTYANYQEARKALYMETVLPLMDIYREELNAWLVPLYGEGLRLEYDKDGIEALQENRGEQYQYIAAAKWMTVNEKRQETGFDEVPEGDVIMVPMSEIPLDQAIEEPEPPAAIPDALKPFTEGTPDEEEEEGEEEDEVVEEDDEESAKARKSHPKSFWSDPERKERLWLTFEARVRTREKSFAIMARDYQRAQAERIRQRVQSKPSLDGVLASDLFNVKDEAKIYVKKFYAWYKDAFVRAGNAGMRAAKGELFDDAELKAGIPTSWVFRLTVALEETLRALVFNSGTKVNETTVDIIYEQLKRAQAENLPVAKFAQDLHDKIAADLSRARSMLWARTESAKVDNFGQLEGYKETEFVDEKGWLCSFVPESRDDHIAASGREVKLDETFDVGGEDMMYPGDPAGSPGNVCNCLCSTYPVVGE